MPILYAYFNKSVYLIQVKSNYARNSSSICRIASSLRAGLSSSVRPCAAWRTASLAASPLTVFLGSPSMLIGSPFPSAAFFPLSNPLSLRPDALSLPDEFLSAAACSLSFSDNNLSSPADSLAVPPVGSVSAGISAPAYADSARFLAALPVLRLLPPRPVLASCLA